MKYLLASLFLLFTIFQLKSQDAVFSQFYLSPLNLNPALAGAECGDQLILNYRDQWRTILKSNAYRTGSFSYDRPFSLKNGDRVGVGVKLTNDIVGTSRFQTTRGAAAFSYQKKVFQSGENSHFLSGGIDAGLVTREIDGGNLIWGTQHDGQGGFDSTLVSGEEFPNINYFNLGIGLLYKADFKKIKNLNFGLSLFNINRPKDLPIRYAFHASGDISITPRFDIRPRAFYTAQSSAGVWIADLGFRFFMNKKATHSLEFSAGGKLPGRGGINTLLISGAYFYKNIGFSVLTEFNGEELNGSGIDSYEGALIYRFCK